MIFSSRWKRGLIFGTVCGLFGGAAWALVIFLRGEKSDIWVAAPITGLFWAVFGFILGSLRPNVNNRSLQQPPVAAQSLLGKVVALAGSFLYRSVVGFLVGSVVASLIEAIGFGLATAVYGDFTAMNVSIGSPIALASQFAFIGSVTASFIGGLLGGWICPLNGRKTAVNGSILGGILGFFGGAVAALLTTRSFIPYAAIVAGVLAGIAGPLVARRQQLLRKPLFRIAAVSSPRLLFLICLPAFFLFAFFEPNRVLIGTLNGEAFFNGRPTSYWREILLVEGRSGKISVSTKQNFKEVLAIPVLRECLEDPDRNVRWPAAALLRRFNGFTDRILPALKKSLHDEDEEVRLQALLAVMNMGPNAQSAITDLIVLLKDPNTQIRDYADIALWEVHQPRAMEATGWKDYHFPMWNFSAKFPSIPTEGHLQDARTVHSFKAAHGVTQCIVTVTDFSEEEIGELSEEERCDLVAEGLANKAGGKSQNKGLVEQNGLKGFEYAIEAEGMSVKGEMQIRYFWQERRLYQVFATFDRDFLNPKAMECFLNSFRLENHP